MYMYIVHVPGHWSSTQLRVEVLKFCQVYSLWQNNMYILSTTAFIHFPVWLKTNFDHNVVHRPHPPGGGSSLSQIWWQCQRPVGWGPAHRPWCSTERQSKASPLHWKPSTVLPCPQTWWLHQDEGTGNLQQLGITWWKKHQKLSMQYEQNKNWDQAIF